MTTTFFPPAAPRAVGVPLYLGLLLLAVPLGRLGAQPPPVPLPSPSSPGLDWQRDPILPLSLVQNPPAPPAGSANRPERVLLFRIQPGFMSDPVGLFDDDPAATPPDPKGNSDDDWINVNLGVDNPYFDFRMPGDPGGIGFYRVNTQVQLFDTSTTACSASLQAYTPSGIQFNGLPDSQGAKVVTPAFSLFHALDEGVALQGYVGKNMLVQSGGSAPVSRDLRYGLALQQSIGTLAQADPLRNLFLSVGALGETSLDSNRDPTRPPFSWDVVPGLHWKVADNCWLRGGVMLPVTNTGQGVGSGQWQFSCQWQF
jgi:hypothetical protein